MGNVGRLGEGGGWSGDAGLRGGSLERGAGGGWGDDEGGGWGGDGDEGREAGKRQRLWRTRREKAVAEVEVMKEAGELYQTLKAAETAEAGSNIGPAVGAGAAGAVAAAQVVAASRR